MVKSYDERSFELAQYFLADESGAGRSDAHELALEIQETIEDWIEYTLRPRLAAMAERQREAEAE
jgi:hypothetical protein